MGGQLSDAQGSFSSPVPPPSPDSNARGQRLAVPPEPPQPNASLGSYQRAWLAGSHCFPGRDSHVMGCGPGLDLRGPSVLPVGPGTSPALCQGFLSSAVGSRFPVGVCGCEFSVLKEGKRWPCRRIPTPAAGLPLWLLVGAERGAGSSPRPAYRPGGREDKQLSHLVGRFMVLPEEACPGPLQPRTALEAGTINPARYFLRASHPINNSFGWCAQLHALASWPGLRPAPARQPCRDPST